MIARHVAYYMGSKVFAAALNLASVAVFARMAGAEIYGVYLVLFATAYIIYGFAIQWLRNSFFAAYRSEDAAIRIATFGRMLAGMIGGMIAVALVVAATGWIAISTIAATVALVISIAVYDSCQEVARTRLEASTVAYATVLRAVVMIIAGASALHVWHSAPALAAGVALANLIAVIPFLRSLRPILKAEASLEIATEYVRYGWPLILAFGVSSAGQNSDRLLLAHVAGAHAVGPYGALSDLIKQSLVVVSEAISVSYISIAKRLAGDGDWSGAGMMLTKAFHAYSVIAAFGGAFILCFAGDLTRAILGPQFHEASGPVIPLITAATAALVFRSFYFGQVIYFGGRSSLELWSSMAMIATVAAGSLFLIPHYLATGAAVSLLLGQLVGCAVFVVAIRRSGRMPLPIADFFMIASAASIAYGAALAAADAGLAFWITVSAQAAILTGMLGAVVVAFDVFGMSEFIKAFRRRMSLA